jgi:hypothetical protein
LDGRFGGHPKTCRLGDERAHLVHLDNLCRIETNNQRHAKTSNSRFAGNADCIGVPDRTLSFLMLRLLSNFNLAFVHRETRRRHLAARPHLHSFFAGVEEAIHGLQLLRGRRRLQRAAFAFAAPPQQSAPFQRQRERIPGDRIGAWADKKQRAAES